jgi:hypothetical protein
MGCDEACLVAFLAGDLSAVAASEVERHLLDCDGCWDAVSEDRAGHRAMERVREVAPAGLADRVRAAVGLAAANDDLLPTKRGRRRLRAIGTIVAALVLPLAAGLWLPLRPRAMSDPAVVAAIDHLARLGPLPADGGSPEGGIDRVLGGRAVTLFRYQVAGASVLLARSAAPFPMPARSMALGPADTAPWLARRGPISLLCVSQPQHVLMAGQVPPAQLLAFARSMGLALEVQSNRGVESLQ